MLPSSVCAATVQPPAQTGMNAQSSHSFHAAIASNRAAASGARRFAPPVDVAGRLLGVAGEARAGVERAVGADGVRVLLWISHGPMCTPSTVGNPRFIVSSRRNDIFSSRKLQLSQTLRRAGAGRRHAGAAERLASATDGQRNELRACDRRRSRPPPVLALADDRLERDLRQLVGELLLAQEVEQRRIAVDELSSKLPPIEMRHLPATWRMF